MFYMNKKEYGDLIKRFLLTFLCCIPIFVGLNILMKGKVDNFIIILINVVIGGIVFFLEELTHNKILESRKKRKEQFEKEQKEK